MSLISIVIPCYNESNSIPILFQKAQYITSHYDIEILLLDNGSNDNTWELMQSAELNNKIRFIRIKQNRGYGYGIKFALKYASSKYIGWTHADLQTDLFDIVIAYEKIKLESLKKNNQDLLAIKGVRYGRRLSEELISNGMSSIAKFLFFPWKTFEINAQPSIYHKSIKSHLSKFPDDYNFDIYAYLLSFRLKFKQIRFPVLFPSRTYGKSHWNINSVSKLFFIFNTLRFILKMYCKFRKF